LRLLERVVVHGPSRLSCRLLARLAEAGVGVLIEKSRYHGGGVHIVGEAAGDRALKRAQYRLADDEPARLPLARGFVAKRATGAMALLRELDSGRGPAFRRALSRIAEVSPGLAKAADLATLRGLEGASAAAFFEAYREAFAPALNFTTRNRRPPLDPVNVCLSIGYTLAHHDAVRFTARAGLDPMIGVYHEPAPGRESLACDLVETVRAAVERHVHAVFAARRLTPQDFTFPRQGGCQMGKAGRKSFYESFEAEAAPGIRDTLAAEAAGLAAALRAIKPGPP
jgi:CRISP-associated protein Cas1